MKDDDLIEEIRTAESSLNLLGCLLMIGLCLIISFLIWAIPYIIEHLR